MWPSHPFLLILIPWPKNYDRLFILFCFKEEIGNAGAKGWMGWLRFYVVVKFKFNKSYISFKNNLLVAYKYCHGWIKRKLSRIFCIFKLLFMLPKIDSMWFFFNNQFSIIFLSEKVCVRSYCHSGFPCKGFDSNSTELLNKTKYNRSEGIFVIYIA